MGNRNSVSRTEFLVPFPFFSFCQYQSFSLYPSFAVWKLFWSHFSPFPFTSSWRPISGLRMPFYFRLVRRPLSCHPANSSRENFLRTIALYCLKFDSFKSTVEFSPSTEFLFCNQITLERYFMSDNPLTHVNLNLKGDIFTFWNTLSIIISNQPSTSTPFGHNHVLTTS